MNVEQHRTLDSKDFLLQQVPRLQDGVSVDRVPVLQGETVGIHGGLLISLAKKKSPAASHGPKQSKPCILGPYEGASACSLAWSKSRNYCPDINQIFVQWFTSSPSLHMKGNEIQMNHAEDVASQG